MNNIIEFLNEILPIFEIRFILLAQIILALLFIELVPIFFRKSEKATRIYTMVILSISMLVIIAEFILIFIQKLPSNLSQNTITTVGNLSILTVLLVSKIITFVISLTKKKFPKALKICNLSIAILTIIYLIIVLSLTLFERPYAYNKTASSGTTVAADQLIEIGFTSPVKTSNLKVNLSPDQEKKVEYDYFLGIPFLVKGIKITPIISFPPETPVIVYITGVQNLAPIGKLHEESIEFTSPSTPKVLGTSVDSQESNVAINTDISIDLDSTDQDFVKWDVKIEPETEYKLGRNNSNKLTIDTENLKQGTTYTISIYQTTITYNTQTKEEVTRDETKLVKTISFTTTPQPGVKSFNRKSGFVSNSEPVRIEFENPLTKTDFSGYFNISPSVKGTLSLDSTGKILIFTPSSEFAKGQKYTVTIKKGLKTTLGGYLENDITLTFYTPGETTVSGMTPSNGSTNINISTKSVAVSFNQPVNKSSAQEHFSISPNIGGTFSWSGNTMYYTFSGNLAYYTKYKVTVASGVESLYGINSSKSYSTSFTTKIETFILNVPQYYQKEKFSCNLEATRMVLSYRGISASVDGIRNWIGIGENPNTNWVTGYGTHASNIARYINSRGRTASVKTGWNASGLAQEIKKGNPVILWVYNNYTQPRGTITLPGGYTGYNGMHSEVAVGFTGSTDNPTQIITNDPWRGRRYLSISTLNSLWSYLGYTAVVVY